MGASQSSSDEIGGFRIFKVNPGSPASEAGLEVFFDFIIEINGTQMDSDQTVFAKCIQDSEGQRAKLVVYNLRTHTSRDVYVTPRRWGGAGLLGAVVRFDLLESAESQGMRVLDVFPNSPAETAGLLPYKDFLLGTTEVMFRDMDELSEVVTLCLGKPMSIYVYNCEMETVREVSIVPRIDWGGDGALGADIRTGLLHRIPPPRRRSPGEGGFSFPSSQAPMPMGSPAAVTEALGSVAFGPSAVGTVGAPANGSASSAASASETEGVVSAIEPQHLTNAELLQQHALQQQQQQLYQQYQQQLLNQQQLQQPHLYQEQQALQSPASAASAAAGGGAGEDSQSSQATLPAAESGSLVPSADAVAAEDTGAETNGRPSLPAAARPKAPAEPALPPSAVPLGPCDPSAPGIIYMYPVVS
ncbi:unnamed protein product [Polarella glacialis]|uniref:PDZ GRASP-type domain-containing protein n=1 Tax=Polarella glacialis TaxID=89957 RepID=A0A813JLX4_POLGL|nr:unnamed protein product [Polarella glacialis]